MSPRRASKRIAMAKGRGTPTAKKVNDKPQDKTQDKTQDKPQDKTQDKPQDKTQDKPQDKTQDKPQDKRQDNTSQKPASDEPRDLDPAPQPFEWTAERTVELLFCMSGLKPAGLNKHCHVMLIKDRISERLNMKVPVKEIWRFLHAHWDMDLADRIESPATLPLLKPRDFELPKTEDWIKLIEEEGAKLRKEAAAQAQMNQPSTSRGPPGIPDITKFKTVKVMVEKMDIDLNKYLKGCKINDSTTELENKNKDGVPTESTSSDVKKTGFKRKRTN